VENKASLSLEKFKEDDNKEWAIDYFRGIFLQKAEEDYISCRILLNMDLTDQGLYHLQQCMEKYMKAFVLDNNIEINPGKKNKCDDFLKNGHKLEYWANICARKDKFFEEKNLIEKLPLLSHLEEISRYPQNKFQSRSFSPSQLLIFLDEFVSSMIKKIEHLQYRNVIYDFYIGRTIEQPHFKWDIDKKLKPEQIKEFLIFNNNYIK